VIGPDATGLCDFLVRRAASLVDGLVVNADRMRQNLELTGGLFFSEAVLLELVRKGLPRQGAYELVQRNALRAAEARARGGAGAEGASFRANLGADPDISARLSAAEIDRAFDLQHHLRHANRIIDRALGD
jgi:adenylosuccinate lyase